MGISFSVVLVFSLFSLCFADVEAQDIDLPRTYVSSSCNLDALVDSLPELGGNCTELDDALDDLSSGVMIVLDRGVHLIKRPHHIDIRGASNIMMIGAGAEETVITCADQNGLSFVGVTNLTLINFTLTDCGLSGSNMLYHVTLLRELLDLWYMIPSTTKVGLFLGHCTNVLVQDVNITRTAGLGFLGINILGKSCIERSGFTSNVRPKCINKRPPIVPSLIDPNDYDQVGGGAFILYADVNTSSIETTVQLNLSELYFAHNADCTFAATTIMNFPYFTESNHALYEYSIGAGGGLSVILSNSDFPVAVNINKTIFYQNEARYGSGAFIATFAGFQKPLNVTFRECAFTENGLLAAYNQKGYQTHTQCKGGAGLAIFSDLLKPNHFRHDIPASHVRFIFEMVYTEFVSNEAQVQGGGIFAYSLQNTPQQVSSVNDATKFYLIVWYFQNVTFTSNSAMYGSVGFFDQMTGFSFDGSVLLVLANITGRKNRNSIADSNALDVTDEASTMHIENMVAAFRDITLEDNIGSAMRLDSTVASIQPGATLIFRGNTAHRGGALHLRGHSPALIVHENCSIYFEDNAAYTEGGAIYHSLPSLSDDTLVPFNFRGCFLLTPAFSSAQQKENLGIFDLGIKLVFKNNRAPIGSTIFGSPLESCSWAINLTSASGENTLYRNLYRDFSSTFYFDRDPAVERSVSSLPASIRVTTGTEGPLEVFPGQALPIGITVRDSYNNTIPAIVTSQVDTTMYETSAKSVLGESGFWYTDVTDTSLSVGSTQNGSVSVSIFTVTSSVSTTISVNLSSCPIGFELNRKTLRCDCSDHFLNQSNVTCNRSSISFEVSDTLWIGVDPTIDEPTSDNLTLSMCIFNYCRSKGTKTVLPNQFDSQCNFNRTGILCGSCNREQDYSSVFGSYECHKCSNNMLLLIIAFAIAGAVLFSGIFFLEITIDKGWTNSIIFFCSIVFVYDYTIPLGTNLGFGFLPARLLNLQIGISLCFYDGMTALSRAGLQLVFPTYLYVLMLVFTILCKRYSWMSTHFSPAKTLMTLSIMCYTSVLSTCVELIGPLRIESLDGTYTSYRWYNDPNQVYFQGMHAFLCAVSIGIVLIYIIPFPIILLFPSLAYKSFVKCTPLLDALWAAYKPKYRFWLGLRLLSVAVFIVSTRLPQEYGIFFGVIYAICFFQIQGAVLPFKERLANISETFFISIVLLFYWGNLSLIAFPFTFRVKIIASLYVAILVTTSYVVMIILFILHLHCKFPCLWQKLRSCSVKQLCFRKGKGQGRTKSLASPVANVSATDLSNDCRTSVYVRQEHFSNQRFRESLLGSIV